jgi:hypothetical protein
MFTFLAFVAFFILTGLKDFGIVFKYQDLLRGVAAFIVVVALFYAKGSVL